MTAAIKNGARQAENSGTSEPLRTKAMSPKSGLSYSETMLKVTVSEEAFFVLLKFTGVHWLLEPVVKTFRSDLFVGRKMVKWAVEVGLEGER